MFDDPAAQGTVRFEAAIPITAVAEPRFFAGPLRITARMHDMDGGPETYKMLQQAIEKKTVAGPGSSGGRKRLPVVPWLFPVESETAFIRRWRR